jgi:F0F1-type ATP synthase assembly protein I/cytoskeletal protein CcmA (bactofilin family)
MKRSAKLLGVFALMALLALTFAAPARAFDGRGGDTITIAANEVVNDDLYVGATVFTLDGTVKGDLTVGAQTVIINGTVEGDLNAAAQTIIINGTVKDDVRIAGYGLLLDSKSSVGDDLIAAGFSLETRAGSTVGGDLVFGGGQALLAGSVAGKAKVGTNGLALRGSVGGDMEAAVGEVGQENGPPPSLFMPPQQGVQIPIPLVASGLTLDPGAKIGGNLTYTQTKDLNLPAGVVIGKITRAMPNIENQVPEHISTPAERVSEWGLNLLRSMVTLILIGLTLGWLFPTFKSTAEAKLQSKPWPSLGWGVVVYAVFFFALLLIILIMVFGGIFFGALTLGGLSGAVIWLGLLAIFAGIIGFVLSASFITKILVGTIFGKWILKYISPSAAEHKIWPMITGIVVLVFIIGMLRFPLAPLGFFGWLLNFAVVLFGFGALWLWGREKFAKKPVVSVQ